MAPSDYDEFAPFFDAVCQEYHKAGADAVHVTDWDASSVGDKGVLDVTKLGLSELSMRVRVGRNLTEFNLPEAARTSKGVCPTACPRRASRGDGAPSEEVGRVATGPAPWTRPSASPSRSACSRPSPL